MKTVVVYPNGETVIKNLNGYEDFRATLNGGWLEGVSVGKNFAMYIDEDGISKKLPQNQKATALALMFIKRQNKILLINNYIRGTAIFLGIDSDGTECDLKDEIIKEITCED